MPHVNDQIVDETAGDAIVTGNGVPMALVVYERLLDALMSMDIVPGQRLTVDSLARDFHVSQTPIREALSRLESEDLVEKHHLRGYRATARLTPSELRNLILVASLLVRAAAEWAATKAGPDDLAELETLFTQMTSAVASRDHGAFARRMADFDRRVVAASRNPALKTSLGRMHVHIHLFRQRPHSFASDEALVEYRLILDALRRRDPLVAGAAMSSHAERTLARLLGNDATDGLNQQPVSATELIDDSWS